MFFSSTWQENKQLSGVNAQALIHVWITDGRWFPEAVFTPSDLPGPQQNLIFTSVAVWVHVNKHRTQSGERNCATNSLQDSMSSANRTNEAHSLFAEFRVLGRQWCMLSQTSGGFGPDEQKSKSKISLKPTNFSQTVPCFVLFRRKRQIENRGIKRSNNGSNFLIFLSFFSLSLILRFASWVWSSILFVDLLSNYCERLSSANNMSLLSLVPGRRLRLWWNDSDQRCPKCGPVDGFIWPLGPQFRSGANLGLIWDFYSQIKSP